MGKYKELAQRGDEAAIAYLKRHGYKVIETAFVCYAGATDVIAYDEEENALVFADVRSAVAKWPDDADKDELRRKFEDTAPVFLAENDEYTNVRMRQDMIYLRLVDTDRAMIKHHVDVLN